VAQDAYLLAAAVREILPITVHNTTCGHRRMAPATGMKLLIAAQVASLAAATHDTFLHKSLSWSSAAEASSAPPSVTDVMSQVTSVNESFNTGMEMIATANKSASDMADQVMGFLTTAGTALTTGKTMVEASAIVLGADLAKTMTDAITKANDTLTSIKGPIDQMLDDAEAKLESFVAKLMEQRESISTAFLSAQAQVQNVSDAAKAATSLLQRTGMSNSAMHRASLMSGKCLQREPTVSYLAHAGLMDARDATKLFGSMDQNKDDCLSQSEWSELDAHSTHALSLLARATITSSKTQTQVLEQSISRKGSGTPCDQAMATITHANSSVAALAEELTSLNTTGVTLVSTAEGSVTSALGLINTTIKMVTLMAPSTVPSSVTSPLTAIADKALSTSDKIVTQAASVESQISGKLDTALSPLTSLVALSSTLAAAATDACTPKSDGSK